MNGMASPSAVAIFLLYLLITLTIRYILMVHTVDQPRYWSLDTIIVWEETYDGFYFPVLVR